MDVAQKLQTAGICSICASATQRVTVTAIVTLHRLTLGTQETPCHVFSCSMSNL